MSSAMSGVGGCSSAGGMSGTQRPDTSKMVDNLFSKLDTKGRGYIEKSDFQGAFDKVASKSASADDVFKALDGNDDGKITKQEMSDSVTKLADQLVSQLQSMRMSGNGGSASQKLNDLAQNFDVADTNHDGNISAQELMAYQASNSAPSSTSDAQNGDAQVMARIMDLMATYGASAQDEQTSGSTISTAA
jgi:Ca2+-binding EF-hand superfamily protein